MGFEEDFERNWHDRHWGKPFRHCAKAGDPEAVGHDITAAICAMLRETEPSGEQNSLLTLVDIFTAHRHRIVSQPTLFHDDDLGCQAVLEPFRQECAPVLRSEENSTNITILYNVAAAHLEDAFYDGSAATTECPAAQTTLVAGFLCRLAEAHLHTARVVAGQRCKTGPEVAAERLRDAIAVVPAEEIASQFLARKGKKIRAPKCRRLDTAALANTSLLSPDQE